MKIRKHSLALTAAFTGLLGGTMARLNAAPASDSSNPTASSLAGKLSTTSNADKKDKHACEGKNSCKGNGGCSSGDQGCSGKNTCKGKGGCATDSSMDKKK